ncbi:MAG: AMP-binding protein [Gordonia sp. (in: high G+C Gram-positive bacteria)]
MTRPHLAVSAAADLHAYGPVAGALRAAARRFGDRTALVDEARSMTYAELDVRTDHVAAALRRSGHSEGTIVAILCRDHCRMVEAMMGAAKAGAGLVLMNTGMSASELHDVCVRERVGLLVHDAEFAGTVADVQTERLVVGGDGDEFDSLVARGTGLPAAGRPDRPGKLIVLTGGTTGTPKGAPRTVRSPLVAAQFLDRIPLPVRGTTLVCAPLFHGTGLSQFLLSVALGTTTVLVRRFDPVQALSAIAEHRCTTVVLVPTMLGRILSLGTHVIDRYDTSSVSVMFCAGSPLPVAVAEEASAVFGPVIYNLYGSSEVGVAAVATPADMVAAPGTVGLPPASSVVRIYDENDRIIDRPHRSGTVYVGGLLSFTGYSGGGHKKSIDGLLSSGDVGHRDEQGRLFIDGRDDDMIVSGGENVFPGEVEDLLYAHPDIDEAAIAPVPDDDFGQRLVAYVVPRAGADLDEERVRDYVKAKLSRYKVPREVVFLAELPRTPSGKLLRRNLTGE